MAVLDYEDLHDVVLVGHSYGGMVITGVAQKAASRIAQLVYLDAFLPENGRSAGEYSSRVDVHAIAETIGDGWRVPTTLHAEEFGITDSTDAAWVDARLSDHPYLAFTQSLVIEAGFPGPIERAFILTTQGTFLVHAERAKKAGFAYRELFTAGHDAMVTQPGELVTLLLDLA